MKKVSIKNLSLLGLVLLGASAVTAAIMPKEDSKKVLANGQIALNSDGAGNERWTCEAGGANPDCDYTATDDVSSNTSAGGNTSATVDITTGTLNTGDNLTEGITYHSIAH